MGDAQITYDGKTISLKKARSAQPPEFMQEQNQNRAASGIIETINIYDIINITLPAFFSQQIYYDLRAWWAWAKQGKAFAFAFDTDRVASTTLDDAAAAGQKTVPLTATTNISAGDFLYIKTDGGDDQEVIEVDTISAGVSVDAVENLKYTYAGGDACRHDDYFPAVKKAKGGKFKPTITDSARPVTDDHYYQYTFKFIEDKT